MERGEERVTVVRLGTEEQEAARQMEVTLAASTFPVAKTAELAAVAPRERVEREGSMRREEPAEVAPEVVEAPL
jgi:hypothetical protein